MATTYGLTDVVPVTVHKDERGWRVAVNGILLDAAQAVILAGAVSGAAEAVRKLETL